MTLEEKAQLVVGKGMKLPGVSGTGIGMTDDKIAGAAGTLSLFRVWAFLPLWGQMARLV